ncbi:hypothetical protein ACIRS1_05535 [Kitasatospora sp. NPDC101176]|uniref:hypothetical protein n=1 Tax=Kitasatospora sp. NPDC101176 TaxID=3364099 RepID=UPI0037FE7308
MTAQWTGQPSWDQQDLWRPENQPPPPPPRAPHFGPDTPTVVGGRHNAGYRPGPYPAADPRFQGPQPGPYDPYAADPRFQGPPAPYPATPQPQRPQPTPLRPRATTVQRDRRVLPAAVGGPLVGGALAQLSFPAAGMLLVGCVALGAAVATSLATRAGWWWILSCGPALVAASTTGAELLLHSARYANSVALGTAVIRSTVEAFPAMVTGVTATLVVMVYRVLRERPVRPPRGARG